jgi:DNA anti-recombination protein RmuC
MSSRERLQYKRALQNLRRERLYGNPMTLEEAKSNNNKTILEQNAVPSGQATVDTARIVGDAAQSNFQAFGQMINQLTSQLQQIRTDTTNQLQELRQSHERTLSELQQQNQQLQQQNQQLQQQLQQARRQIQQARRARIAPSQAAATGAASEPNSPESTGPQRITNSAESTGPQRIVEKKSLKNYL